MDINYFTPCIKIDVGQVWRLLSFLRYGHPSLEQRLYRRKCDLFISAYMHLWLTDRFCGSLIHNEMMLETVHCLRYAWCARRFGRVRRWLIITLAIYCLDIWSIPLIATEKKPRVGKIFWECLQCNFRGAMCVKYTSDSGKCRLVLHCRISQVSLAHTGHKPLFTGFLYPLPLHRL
jgi:hypothetical protein